MVTFGLVPFGLVTVTFGLGVFGPVIMVTFGVVPLAVIVIGVAVSIDTNSAISSACGD